MFFAILLAPDSGFLERVLPMCTSYPDLCFSFFTGVIMQKADNNKGLSHHTESSCDSTRAVRVGVAIAAHNRLDRTRECLQSIRDSGCEAELLVVLVDDGSTDGTAEAVTGEFPEVELLSGDGSLWWAGATNRAIAECVQQKCDYVLLLNQDAILRSDTINILLDHAVSQPRTICAAVNVDFDSPDIVLWAGTHWGPIRPYLPFVFCAKSSLWPKEHIVDSLPEKPFVCDTIVGRATLIPGEVIEVIGLLDAKCFPQYGGDYDYGFRAKKAGFDIHVVPNALVRTRARDSVGLGWAERDSSFFGRLGKMLLSQRHPAHAIVQWRLLSKHAPWWAVVPSYAAISVLTCRKAWIETHIIPSLH